MNNQTFYDELFAGGLHEEWRNAPGKLVILKYFKGLVQNDQKLLDIGCGDGFLLNWIREITSLAGKDISVFGIDISPHAIKLAKQEHTFCDFSVMNAEAMTFDSDKFDWIISYGVYEHLASPLDGINEMSRVLINGGRFAFMIPTIGYYRDDRYDEGRYDDMNDPPQMQWNYRRETWATMFNNSGLILEPDEVAVACGALKAGNFYFGSRS